MWEKALNSGNKKCILWALPHLSLTSGALMKTLRAFLWSCLVCNSSKLHAIPVMLHRPLQFTHPRIALHPGDSLVLLQQSVVAENYYVSSRSLFTISQ